jgi:hypothetical protein
MTVQIANIIAAIAAVHAAFFALRAARICSRLEASIRANSEALRRLLRLSERPSHEGLGPPEYLPSERRGPINDQDRRMSAPDTGMACRG